MPNTRMHNTTRPPARRLHRGRPSLVALLLAQALAASAQSSPDEPGDTDTRQLESVTVTARRSIEQRFFATGSLVVVDRRDIEQLGAFSIADVLRQLPGVQVTPTADGGVEIRMRGMERGATQLLIDGQRTATGRSQLPLDQLPAEVIERIEVVRAPTAEFSGATGGTLNIVLRQASVQRETLVRLTDNRVWGRDAGQLFFSKSGPLGGSAASPAPRVAARPEAKAATAPEAAAGASSPASSAAPAAQPLPVLPIADKPWSYFVAVSDIGYLLGSDVHRQTRDNGAVVVDSDASGRYRRSDLTLLPRLNGWIGASDQLALRANLSRAHFSGRYDSDGNGIDSNGPYQTHTSEAHTYERHYLQAAADWTHRFERSKLETTLSVSRAKDTVDRTGDGEQRYASGTVVAAPYGFNDRRQENLRLLSAKLSGTASPLLWSAGALSERRSLDVDNLSSSLAAPVALNIGITMQRDAVWAQNEWELPANTTLTAGLRAETLAIDSTDAGLLASRRNSFLQPSLHLRTPIDDNLQWRANLARVTRNPRIWDLVDRSIPSQGSNSINSPDTIGNPLLRPEVAWTLDTGFERRIAPQGQVGLNLFVRQLSHTIAQVTSLVGARWVEQRSNVGDATVWGLEADAKTGLTWAGLGRDWTLSANASLLQSRMTGGPTEGSRIPGQARYLASVTVAKPLRRSGGLFGGATVSLTGPAQLNTSPGITGRTQARASLDVYIGSVVPGWGYWRVGVFNIGDAPFDRERSYAGTAGSTLQSDSRMTLTPRVYLTVGTQF